MSFKWLITFGLLIGVVLSQEVDIFAPLVGAPPKPQDLPDWDWANCHHGYFVSSIAYGEAHCVCDPGWGGTDCSLCLSDESCSKGEICDTSMPVKQYKAYNCHNEGNAFIPQGTATAEWFLDDNQENGHGVISVFRYPNGADFIFNCTFNNCAQDQVTYSMTCEATTCHCSTWCSAPEKTIIGFLSGAAVFSCNQKTGYCLFEQQNLPLALSFQCVAAGCQVGPPTPPPYHIPTEEVVAIGLGVGTTSLFAIIGLVAFILVKRRNNIEKNFRKTYQLLSVSERSHHCPQVTLSFSSLNCEIFDARRKVNRKVLNDLTGVALPGRIMAIMGPSGAGKTTFIDIIAQRKTEGKVTGTILVNGKPYDRTFKRLSGYVYQDDRMLGTMTVKEHLLNSARLRLPSNYSYVQILRRVYECMEELNISHIADSLIGVEGARGISGGERKRLAIAAELVTDPSILFLDEPTSGLDSYNAHSLMKTLKKMAQEHGRTIIVSVHQPRSNIYHLFDDLMLLANGELVYFGPTKDALPHFKQFGKEIPSNFNPADWLVDQITENTKIANREICSVYKNSPIFFKYKKLVQEINSGETVLEFLTDELETGSSKTLIKFEKAQNLSVSEYASSVFTQFFVLCERTLTHNFRNPHLLQLQYLLMVVLGVVLGAIYWKIPNSIAGVQNRTGALFFMTAFLTFSSLSSIDSLFEERVLFIRERSNGMYRTSMYFFAKMFCDLIPMRVIPPVVLGSIVYWMAGLYPTLKSFLIFLAIIVMINVCAGSFVLALSAVTPSISLGNLIGILFMLYSLLFCGLLVNNSSLPTFLVWVKWPSFLNYGFEALATNDILNLTVRTGLAPPITGRWILIHIFGLDPDRFFVDMWVLGGMIVFYMVVSYLFLRFAVKEKR